MGLQNLYALNKTHSPHVKNTQIAGVAQGLRLRESDREEHHLTMAATRESIKGNGASVQGALFRDRCWRSWWKNGQHRATCTTFLEGQFWKSSKTMAMTWLTQSSLAEFRSVFGNSFNIDSLCLSVSLRSNRHKKVCLILLFYFFIECFNLVYDMGFL